MRFRANVKRYFLDRKRVIGRVKQRRRVAMMRVGGFIRTVARRSMKVAKGASSPGTPPNAHLRHLKDGIWFVYDANTDTVVCGPAKAPLKGYDVPAALELGGRITLDMVRCRWHDPGEYKPAHWFKREDGILERRRITFEIKSRPYMEPARDVALVALPEYLTNLL